MGKLNIDTMPTLARAKPASAMDNRMDRAVGILDEIGVEPPNWFREFIEKYDPEESFGSGLMRASDICLELARREEVMGAREGKQIEADKQEGKEVSLSRQVWCAQFYHTAQIMEKMAYNIRSLAKRGDLETQNIKFTAPRAVMISHPRSKIEMTYSARPQVCLGQVQMPTFKQTVKSLAEAFDVADEAKVSATLLRLWFGQ